MQSLGGISYQMTSLRPRCVARHTSANGCIQGEANRTRSLPASAAATTAASAITAIAASSAATAAPASTASAAPFRLRTSFIDI